MKRKLKIALSLLFVLLFALQGLVAVFAAESKTMVEKPVIERFTNIKSYSCNCYISGLTIYASATLTPKSSMYLHIKMELQKYSSGDYNTIETWTDSKTGTFLSMDKSKLINVFSTYRIKVTFTAGGESTTSYAYA